MDEVAVYPITQATTATFTDLYLRLTFLFFIQAGAKKVVTPKQDLIGSEGDLLVFPAGSLVTMENRPVLDRGYRALGVAFPDEMVRRVFGERGEPATTGPIHLVRAEPDRPLQLLPLLQDTLDNPALPRAIRSHRLMEPLLWLRELGLHIPTQREETPLSRVRRLIEADPGRDWRAVEVAAELAMSGATMRRQLARSGQGFAKVLLHTRLERGLTLLQTTDGPISDIALSCGFKTPSHFSDAFRTRFGIRPRDIRTAAG